MNELYRPSCGAEGADFMHQFCHRCERDRAFREDQGEGCDIVFRAMAFGDDEPGYPQEWTYDADGLPTCTAFVPSTKEAP